MDKPNNLVNNNLIDDEYMEQTNTQNYTIPESEIEEVNLEEPIIDDIKTINTYETNKNVINQENESNSKNGNNIGTIVGLAAAGAGIAGVAYGVSKRKKKEDND